MARQLFPALRGLLVPRGAAESPPPPTETKDLLAGGVYTSVTLAGVTNVWGTPGRADGWDLERVIVEGYERSIWTFKSVEAISKHASTLPIQIGRGGDEREFAEVLEEHPLLRLLNKQANPLETGDVFKKRLSAQLLLSKKGVFIEKTKSRGGVLARLDLLPPDRVEVIPDDENASYVKHFQFTDYRGHIRELPPEKVIWIRDPHPTDPFCGVTPLEAAGLSVELDVAARTYNISFIANDGRPGGIVGIDLDGVDPKEVDRIQKRLAPGAHNAGQLTLVGTGPGGVTYVDTSARPREMAYETLSSTAKNEILSAFGVYESVIGNASERTFNNADREEWNFWSHTELPHLNLIASAFDPDLSDDWVIRFDTSRVQALEFPRRQAREEARKEFEAGLITIDEYRKIANRKPFNTPQSRALWISPQKAPVPANDQDAAALGLAPEPGAGAAPGADPNAALPAADGDQSAATAVAQARELEAGPTAAADVALARGEAPLELPTGTAGSAADEVAAARAQSMETGPGAAADDVASARATVAQAEDGPAAEDVAAARAQLETKALTAEGFEVTDADFDALALAIQATLTALLARQQGVIVARLRAPKTRKHTRFWEPENEHDTRGGDANIDEDRVVSAARWAEETTNTLAPILQQAATATARKLGQAVAGTDAVAPAAVAAALVTAMYAGEAVTALLGDLAEELRSLQTTPGAELTLEDLERAVVRFYEAAAPALVARVAETCAVSTVNGAADAAAESAGPGVIRTWVTRQDDRVRPAHKALHGKTLPVGTPYEIDGAQLRYPGDPFAPIALTINCRCRLHYATDKEPS